MLLHRSRCILKAAWSLTWALSLFAMVFSCGCSRVFYREQADRQVYDLVEEKSIDARWQAPDFSIVPDVRSRFYDATDPDSPPLPPDDPTAREYMNVVYGMKGSKKWKQLGEIDVIENPFWRAYLDPAAAEEGRPPAVQNLTAIDAIHLSLIHSREYQTQLENLYLAALAVTLERYQFDVRPTTGILGDVGLGEPGGDLFFKHQPDDESNLQLSPLHLGVSKLFPTGAQMAAELVNDTVWLFAGPNSTRSSTTLSYTLIQPLMFMAGRDVVLEDLTQSERNLVYALRDFARFRKEFFTNTITGGQIAGLQRFLRGFEFLAGDDGPNVGFYPTLLRLQKVRNVQENVRSIEALIEELTAQGASQLDITQLESSQASSRSRLFNSVRLYEDRVDQYRVQLGLPPDVDLTLDDSLLALFQFVDPTVITADMHLQSIGRQIRSISEPVTSQALGEIITELIRIREEVADVVDVVREDYARLNAVLPDRLKTLGPIQQSKLIKTLKQDYSTMEESAGRFGQATADLRSLVHRSEQANSTPAGRKAYLDATVRMRSMLLLIVQTLSSVQISARVELIPLQPVEIEMAEATRTALDHRLDLMNRRAIVVDARRKLEVAANAVEATVNVVAGGDLSTPPLASGNEPFDFRATESEFRLGVTMLTPLDRRAQRNDYRATQIAYQRARRGYMASEDKIMLTVRQAVRTLKELSAKFDFNRREVRSGARELFLAQTNPDVVQRGLSLTRALRNLRHDKDDLIEAWLDYESTRINLARDMGTMQIDEQGVWIDSFYQEMAGREVTGPN